MEQKIIEKFEKARYRSRLCQAVFLVVMMAVVLWYQTVNAKGSGTFLDDERGALVFVIAIMVILLSGIIVIARDMLRTARIRRDKELKEALDNEFYRSNNYRAMAIGYSVFTGSCLVGMFLPSLFPGLETFYYIWFILMLGLGSYYVAWLIYNR